MYSKSYLVSIATILLLGITSTCAVAQQAEPKDTAARNEFLFHLTRLVRNNYVYPDIGEEIAENLNEKVSNGYFDQFTDKVSFTEALTSELRSINGDLHFSVRPSVSSASTDKGMQAFSSEFLSAYNNPRKEFNGFDGVQNLGDGVGYLKLSYFRTPAMSVADSYMDLLKFSNTVIIDLRNNHGGTPEMVKYLLSYFFEEPILISTVIGRNGQGREQWTLRNVKGKKLPDVPLFILVNKQTASGAESFSYVIKNQKRGTIIGESTMGAANSVGTWEINGFDFSIPNERNISPVTNTNWELVGVTPDLISTEDRSFDVAFNKAKQAAHEYKTNHDLTINSLFESLWQLLGKVNQEPVPGAEENQIHEIIANLVDKNIINELQINDIGYHYVEIELPKAAEIVFKSNVMINANSANANDSYAESLATNGKLKESIQYYKNAVKFASEQNTGTVEQHQKSLDSVVELLNSKKN